MSLILIVGILAFFWLLLFWLYFKKYRNRFLRKKLRSNIIMANELLSAKKYNEAYQEYCKIIKKLEHLISCDSTHDHFYKYSLSKKKTQEIMENVKKRI